MAKYVVRSGIMRALGVFSPGRDDAYGRGQQVIVRTDRGLEVGEVLTEATEHVLGSMTNPGYGQILRPMTADDVRDQARLHEEEAREFEVCERLIAQEKLDMRLGRRGASVRGRAGGGVLPVGKSGRLSRASAAVGGRVSNAGGNAANWCAGRSQVAGRLRRLRQAGLLQHAFVRNAAGIDEDGQDSKGHIGSDQNIGPLWEVEVLSTIRVRYV